MAGSCGCGNLWEIKIRCDHHILGRNNLSITHVSRHGLVTQLPWYKRQSIPLSPTSNIGYYRLIGCSPSASALPNRPLLTRGGFVFDTNGIELLRWDALRSGKVQIHRRFGHHYFGIRTSGIGIHAASGFGFPWHDFHISGSPGLYRPEPRQSHGNRS